MVVNGIYATCAVNFKVLYKFQLSNLFETKRHCLGVFLPRFKKKKCVTMSDEFVDNKPKFFFSVTSIVGICKSTM
ncbi:hypothetical protein Avbf_14105 [Armadillidium vulgare]|nr:hypothetical protein Avbf_14105 [Armadillidium vulgare]